MKIHHHSIEDAFQSLHSRPSGLAGVEAERRLREFGPNQVERVRGTPWLVRFLKGFSHFFALILWVAAGLAFFAEWQEPGAGMATLAFAILGVILINGLFSFWQEFRAELAMAALQKLLPHQVEVLRDGKMRQAPTEELVPGDVIFLDAGDDIPADCRLIESFGVRVNNATVTGESMPQARDQLPSKEEEALHSRNILLAGTSLVSGQARAVVFATGMHTEFGKIAHLAQETGEVLSPLQKEIARLSHLVALLSLGLGVIFFSIGQALGLTFWHNILFAIGIIIANVPEGLLPTVTLALAMGSQRMAKKNALIRHLPSVETLGSATVICTDKTGTLTQNRMEVRKLFLSQECHDVTEAGGMQLQKSEARNPICERLAREAGSDVGFQIPDSQTDGENLVQPNADWKEAHRTFFEAAFLCHTLKEIEQEGRRKLLGDPLEVALVRMAEKGLTGPVSYPRVDEIPFDSDRRRLSTLHRTRQALVLYTKGALEALLPLCSGVQIGGKAHPLSVELRKEFLDAQDALAAVGLRVLAFAYREIPEAYDRERLEEDLTLSGLVGLLDPPRPEVPAAIARCQEAGIKVIMVTGDHPHTAQAIARQIGLLKGNSHVFIKGEQLRRMSDTQLQLALDLPEIHFARVGADQKMRIVNALKAKGHIVAVTGDGVNDAPALRRADIGIAMGQTGTDVARAAADMVLLDDNFASIVAAIEEGRAVFANIRKFLTYVLTSNVPELVPYLAFVLFRLPLALTVIQILAVDLGTDMLPALGLGADKPESGTMQKPPRSSKERLVAWPLLARSYLFLGLLEAGAAMAAFFFVLMGSGWAYGQALAANDPNYLRATTACLSAIIVMQVANVFLCRSQKASAFTFGLFSNRLIWVGILAELVLILLIVYTSLGNRLFGTAPIAGRVWLFIIPFAAAMFAVEELRKWLVNKSLFSTRFLGHRLVPIPPPGHQTLRPGQELP
jgi:potassium/sodium efflux P-type ATPase